MQDFSCIWALALEDKHIGISLSSNQQFLHLRELDLKGLRSDHFYYVPMNNMIKPLRMGASLYHVWFIKEIHVMVCSFYPTVMILHGTSYCRE